MIKPIKRIALSAALLSSSTFALPIDWHGVFGVDTTLLDNYRMIKSTTYNSGGSNLSQEIPLASGNDANASFQSYIFRLNPHMIVNDSATFKAEFTSGYGRGGRLGDDSAVNGNTATQDSFSHAYYTSNTSSGTNNLVINKLFMELYSDTATYIIGRHSADYGLGAIQNSGDNVWDRHTFVRDGITMKVKLGNFNIAPFWAKIDSTSSLTKATKIREYGLTLNYDNVDKDLGFGLLYTKKKSNPSNTSATGANTGTISVPASSSLGATDVKLTDIYFKKGFGRFNFEIEVPILSGDIGDAYGAGTTTKLKAKALLFSSRYQITEKWTAGLHAGKVSGDDGTTTSFKGMYLNPNFKIANILFNFNPLAVAGNSQNIYDASVNNATYIKFAAMYESEKWGWNAAVITAKAEEIATAGEAAYNHLTHQFGNASATQEDSLGTEIDLGFNYRWNESVAIGGDFGYLFTGDYFAFNDTATPNEIENTFMLQLKTAISF